MERTQELLDLCLFGMLIALAWLGFGGWAALRLRTDCAFVSIHDDKETFADLRLHIGVTTFSGWDRQTTSR